MEKENYLTTSNCQVKDLGRIYSDYFGYITDGFFVDVGAFDGISFSNTAGLVKAGWSGIMYEPVDEFYNMCVHNYKSYNSVKVIKTCIGNKVGTVSFTVAGTLSTYDKEQPKDKFWEGYYEDSWNMFSNITTLDRSLEENFVQENFEVLSIDVEGSEKDVLEEFSVELWMPKMVIIEAQELHPAESLRKNAKFINKYFSDVGYKKIYCDEINNIYVL